MRDVPASIEFYQKVFGIAPQKQEADHVKFDRAAPVLNLSLVSSMGRTSSVHHLAPHDFDGFLSVP